jgi:hypothetical protein
MTVFIQTQFHIARRSAESNKVRRANNRQTRTRLGEVVGAEATSALPCPHPRDAMADQALSMNEILREEEANES